jgi:hypothetical protein
MCVTNRKCLSRLPLLLSSIILPHTASFISSNTPTRKKEPSVLRLCLPILKYLRSILEPSTYPLVAVINTWGGASPKPALNYSPLPQHPSADQAISMVWLIPSVLSRRMPSRPTLGSCREKVVRKLDGLRVGCDSKRNNIYKHHKVRGVRLYASSSPC